MSGPGEKTKPPTEGAGAFGGFIGPETLLSQIATTAPYLLADASTVIGAPPPVPDAERLSDMADDPLGWWTIVRESKRVRAHPHPTAAQRTDYACLCIAAHFATVMTFVPTDVDTKIRNHIWWNGAPEDELRRLARAAAAISRWDVRLVSRRYVDVSGFGPVSGHDGERLSVWCGALLALSARGLKDLAAEMEALIDGEVRREAAAFLSIVKKPGAEIEIAKLAAAITHNAGDIDQGLSASEGESFAAPFRERYDKLAHERFERFDGVFRRAAAVYREIMAPEGHRNYPLRAVLPLRRDPALLLPFGPFLDAWGESLASYRAFSGDEKAAIVDALFAGCRRVGGQMGYWRALCGMNGALPGGLDGADMQKRLAASTKRELKSGDVKKILAVRRESFESSARKRIRAVLDRG